MPKSRAAVKPFPRGGQFGPSSKVVTAYIEGFSRGLDVRRDPAHVDPTSTTAMQNFVVDDTELRKMNGITDFGDNAFIDQILSFTVFRDSTGDQHLLAHSEAEVRLYNESANQWDDLTSATPTTVTATQWYSSAVIASDTPPESTGDGALDSNKVYHVVVNGKDKVYCWDGNSANNFVALREGMGDPTEVPTARFCASYIDRLFLAYVTENPAGTTHSTRVRWSKNGDFAAEDGFTALGSGAVDLTEVPGAITGIKTLGDDLIIYFTEGIMRGSRTGNFTNPVSYASAPGDGVGCIAPRTLQTLPDGRHIFLGTDFNVYQYDGDTVSAIGDSIQRQLQEVVRGTSLNQCHAVVHSRESQYWLFAVTIPNTTYPQTAYIYDWTTKAWFLRQVASSELVDFTADTGVEISAGASFGRETTLTIDNLPGDIDGLSGSIDSLSGTGEPERIVFGYRVKPQTNSVTKWALEGSFTDLRKSGARATEWKSPAQGDGASSRWVAGTTGNIVSSSATNISLVDSHAIDFFTAGAWAGLLATGLGAFDFGFTNDDIPAIIDDIDGLEIKIEGHVASGTTADRNLTYTLCSDATAAARTQLPGTSTGSSVLGSGASTDDIDTIGSETFKWGLGTFNPQIAIVGQTNFGVAIHRTNTPVEQVANIDVIRLDHCQIRVHFTPPAGVLDESVDIFSFFDTIDTDFGDPLIEKTLQRVIVRYRDLSSSKDPLILLVAPGGGTNFSARCSVPSTAGKNDGKIKEAVAHCFVTNTTFRVRVTHATPTNIGILGVQLYAKLGGQRQAF
jgi:hypothetical protein